MEPTCQQKSMFDGLMLSDASLSISGNARFGMTSKHRSFVDAARNALGFLSWGETTERDIYDKRTDKTYHSCRIRSHVNDWLTIQYYRWYVDGVKIVPKDVVIDKDVLEWWYVGDGHLCRKKSRPNYRRIIMATDSFSFQEKEFLCDQLKQRLHNDAVYIEGQKIAIAKQALVRMAQMLTTICPVSDYNYKYEFGPYVDENYHKKAMTLRGPVGGRPKGAKDTKPRKSRRRITGEAQ